MSCSVRAYTSHDLAKMTEIWNQIVLAGNAFPQENQLTVKEAEAFLGSSLIAASPFQNRAAR